MIENEQQEFQLFKFTEGSLIPQFISTINSITNTEEIQVTISMVELSNRDCYDIEIDMSLINDGEYFVFCTGLEDLIGA